MEDRSDEILERMLKTLVTSFFNATTCGVAVAVPLGVPVIIVPRGLAPPCHFPTRSCCRLLSASHGASRYACCTQTKKKGRIAPALSLFLSEGRNDYTWNFRRRLPRPTRAPPSSTSVIPPSGVLTNPVVVKGVLNSFLPPSAARKVPFTRPLPPTVNE